MKSFASDNYAGALPEVIEAIQKVNADHQRSYGADDVTERVRRKIREEFGAEAEIFFVFNGTGANVLCAAAAAPSHRSVLVADISHFYNDESSAPETFTGCRFFPIPANENGKLTPDSVRKRLIRKGDVHYANPALLSVTQSTEYGTVYRPEELKTLSELCRENNLLLHMDGSRIFNAAASLDCSLREITSDCGVDLLSLGGTKLGMLYGEAVVVLNPALVESVRFKQKQMAQLPSKTRFIAAQFEALLEDNVWHRAAGHANRAAQKLAIGLRRIPQIQITKPVEANAIFAIFPPEWIKPLQEAVPFYVWQEETSEVRLMCAWDTTEEEINSFLAAVRSLQARPA